ncbi:ABC transporter substrate-binding protein [Nocardia sp. NBC_01377]|uniref:ABC transporter substrate-binding protein n=1 Tax=Nocardia sp. NBC_01377 TaxID=2903595 RepID=UPI00324EE7C3
MKSGRTYSIWARVAGAVLAGAMAFGLAACGSDEASAGGGDSLTIQHARGETTIDGTPERIVVLGNQWLDTALALGVTPVGYLDNVAVLSKSTPPWQGPIAPSAKQIEATGNIPEQVAALEPDLILADTFIADQPRYDAFSKIAPTLPGLSKEIVSPWQELVTTLGKILHKEDAATALIAGVDSKITAITQANPGLKGKTFASTWLGGPSQLMVLTDPNDGSGKVFGQLGLGIPQNLIDMPSSQGRVSLSPERLDELTSDLLLAGYTPGMESKYRELPGYSDLPSVRKGGVVFLSTQEITAVNQPTVQSIPYILDKLTPALVSISK